MSRTDSTPQRLRASYVMPLRLSDPAASELIRYVLRLSNWLDVVVADSSPADVFAAHEQAWEGRVTHVPVKSERLNGKVAGVVDGLAAAMYDTVVLADDDVRYERSDLVGLLDALGSAAAVVPQNYFAPLPWHARWDTGRTLLNRAFGHDYAGTAALRRDALPHGEYCGAVLFENLEMLRTISANGGTVRYARGQYVRRMPPTTSHFWRQRVRQAYDSFAQPGRFAAELAALPVLLVAVASRAGRRTAMLMFLSVVAAAEVGRRRDGGRAVFSADAPLWAPAWVLERAVCSWAALAWRVRGGVPYAGRRLRIAAHPERRLVGLGCPQAHCLCRDRSATLVAASPADQNADRSTPEGAQQDRDSDFGQGFGPTDRDEVA